MDKTKIQQIETQIAELTKRLDKLNDASAIPYEVEGALKTRLKVVQGDSSSKTAASETIEVSAGVFAATPMDGFITIVVNGNSRQVPYYNA